MSITIDPGGAPALEAPLTTLASKTANASLVSQVRPNNTTAYTAGDVVGGAIGGAGSVAGSAIIPFTFPNLSTAFANGGEFLLTSVEMDRQVAAVVSGETTYSLYLFSAPPVTKLLDNDPFAMAIAGDLPLFLDVITGITLVVPTGSAFIYGRIDGINHQYTLKSNVIYGYLMTVGGYTPVANTVLDIKIHGIAL